MLITVPLIFLSDPCCKNNIYRNSLMLPNLGLRKEDKYKIITWLWEVPFQFISILVPSMHAPAFQSQQNTTSILSCMPEK